MNQKLRWLIFDSFYAALVFVLKLIMAGLANIEPVSLLIIVLAVSTRKKGIWALPVYIFLEFLVFGFHIYSLAYIYVWPFLYYLTLQMTIHASVLDLSLLSGMFGLFFGLLCVPPELLVMSPIQAFSWWAAGIPFDLIHCAGNFILALLLVHPILITLRQIQIKMGLIPS